MGEGCINYCFKAKWGEFIKNELKNLGLCLPGQDNIDRKGFSHCFKGLIKEFTHRGKLISVAAPWISVLLYMVMVAYAPPNRFGEENKNAIRSSKCTLSCNAVFEKVCLSH